MEKEFQLKEEIKLFLQKVVNDKELQKKLEACKSPEEAYVIASSVQEGFTFEEFVEAGQKLKEMVESQDLTDEDLAKAAGGISTELSVSMTVTYSVMGTVMLAWL